MDEKKGNIEQLHLKIVSTTERIVLDKNLEVTVIAIVDAESREHCIVIMHEIVIEYQCITIYLHVQ